MENTILSTEQRKVLTWLALLSRYDLFHISGNDGSEFSATNIKMSDCGCLIFERMFSKSKRTQEAVRVVKASSKKKFVCETVSESYEIFALHEKETISLGPCKIEFPSIYSLMEPDYISKNYIHYIKELDMLILAVDPFLLGELDNQRKWQIQMLINRKLRGLSKSMQISRTVCFQVPLRDSRKRIYAGVYDLERKQSLTSQLVFDVRGEEYISDELSSKSKKFRRFVQSIKGQFIT